MDFEYLFLVVSFSASIFSALFCFILIALKLFDKTLDYFTKKLLVALLSFYLVSIAFNLTIFLYVFDFKTFAWFKAVNFLLALLIPVIFYQIIFKLTRLKQNESFNYFNYLACILLGLTYFIYSEYLVNIPKVIINDQALKNFLFFSDGRIIATISFNIIYTIQAFLRLIRYRKHISHYSSDEGQNSLTWLYNIFVIAFLLFPGPIFFYVIPDVNKSLLFGQLIPNFLFMFFNISLCYNIFSQNFTLVNEDIIIDNQEIDNKRDKEIYIDQEAFEKYIQEQKPFLNPQLKITDLLSDLMTNRTYLSSFINTTYKMNFSQFINNCRYKEYLELKKIVSVEPQNEDDIILASGFRNYENFKRTEVNFFKKSDKHIFSS